MQQFKNILLVAGGEGWESNALERAVALAKNNRAHLCVIDVVEEMPRRSSHTLGNAIALTRPLAKDWTQHPLDLNHSYR